MNTITQDSNFWSDNADLYQLIHENNVKQGALALINLIGLNYLQKPVTILDAGCGSGESLSLELKRNAKITAKIVGVDLAENMIIEAAKKLKSLNSIGVNPDVVVEFIHGDLQQLPIVDGEAFDYYFSNSVYWLLPNPREALKEAYRVLKNDGVIAITLPGRQSESDFFKDFPKMLEELGLDPSKYVSAFDRITKEEVVAMMKESGFSIKYAWYQRVTWNFESKESFGLVERVCFRKYEEEERKKIRGKIYERMEEFSRSQTPPCHEFLYVVGKKMTTI